MGSSKDKTRSTAVELRDQAEKQLSDAKAGRPAPRSGTDSQKQLHELQVHQIELEMQNEALLKSRDDVETILGKYTDLYDFAPVGYCTLGRDGTITEINRAGTALLGVEKRLLTGRRFGQFVAKESRALFALFLDLVFTGQGKKSCVVAFTTVGGNTPVYAHMEALATASGGECRAALIDISARKRLEMQNEHLASFPRLNPNPVIGTDSTGRIIFYNPATVTILESAGLTEAEVELFLPTDMNQILKQWDGLDEKSLYREIVIKEMSFAVTIFLTPLLATGRIYAYNITRIKQAEAEAKKSEALYRAIGEAIDYGIWICTPDGRNTYASQSFLQLVGITQEECAGLGWANLLHPDDAAATMAAWHECVRTEGNWDREHRFRGKDGQWHFIMARGVPVRDEQGRLIYWAGINLDISRRKSAEDALAVAHEGLERKIIQRTKALSSANEQLLLEIVDRKSAENSLQSAYEEITLLKTRLEAENLYLQKEIAQGHNFGEIIGQSAPLKNVLIRVEQVGPMNATVLLLGETGSGKGVVARAIHNLSSRRNRPMITVNCSSLPANLIESELFGRERGAFTGASQRQIGRFELADNGTIFLDEIGEMPLELQSKLLRVLQDGEFERLGSPRTIKVDIRIIAASNRNLKEEIKQGRFREDLFYRLNVFPITIPPLRQRPEDIPLLVTHFIDRFNKKNGKKIEGVSNKTMDLLQGYAWPGNVRELESVIERSVITTMGSSLQLLDRLEKPSKAEEPAGQDFQALSDLEYDHILQALHKTGWRINGEKGAALLLNLNPSTLRARMRKLGISRQ